MTSTVTEQITAARPPVIPAARGDHDAARLVVSRGPWTGTGVVLSGPLTTIGRHHGNDIALGDPTVSAQHAEIRGDGDRYLITDVGSLTGTYVNRQRIDQAELHHGDEVWIGRHRLVFERRTER